MPDRVWKQQPKSLPHAFDLCVQYAKRQHNRSVEQIAELMGMPQPWRLYKWMEDGSLPARYIRTFEHACGCDFVTRWLAHSAHRLLIEIPRGRNVRAADLHTLQAMTNDAVGALIAFATNDATADQVIGTTTQAMEGLAWHRANAEKHAQPELEL